MMTYIVNYITECFKEIKEMKNSAVLYITLLYIIAQYSTLQYKHEILPYNTMQYIQVDHNRNTDTHVVWFYCTWCLVSKISTTVHCSTVQYSTIQYCTVQYSTVHYSKVVYIRIEYNTVQ